MESKEQIEPHWKGVWERTCLGGWKRIDSPDPNRLSAQPIMINLALMIVPVFIVILIICAICGVPF